MGRTDRGVTIAILIFVLGLLGLGAFHYAYEWSILRFPILVGVVACLLCLANLAQGRRGPETARSAADHAKADTPLTFRDTLPAMIWIAAIVPTVFVLGFAIGLPLYVLVYLKTHKQSWIQSVVISICVLAVVYLFFVRILGMPPGLFPAGGL
jgi:DMSO reductase anchor subunit